MLKKLTGCLIIVISIICNNAFANDTEKLKTFIYRNFPSNLQINNDQIEQLSWILQHQRRSFDMDMHVKHPEMHIEISRALTRLYCLQLLKVGGKLQYEQFVAAQIKVTDQPLAFDSFNKLSKHIQQLNADDYELLQTATILSAVSLSGPAEKIAQRILDLGAMPHDNLEFLAATLRNEPAMYPLVGDLLQNDVAMKKLLYVLFPPQTNFRHMLYTEGGQAMFKYLRLMIKDQYIDRDALNLWYAHWIVNIAGFRGHINQRGSLYLTEDVFQAMHTLKPLIDEMLHTPNFDPIIPYLEYRATLLGLQNLPQQQRFVLAHLGCMMRMYNKSDGAKLLQSFKKLSPNVQKQLSSYYFKALNDQTMRTPTYAPALFCNALELSDGDVAKVVQVFLPLYLDTINLYDKKVVAGVLNANATLSFNKLSASKNIQKVLDNPKLLANIKIAANGEADI